jgi:hypothetical protein
MPIVVIGVELPVFLNWLNTSSNKLIFLENFTFDLSCNIIQ